MKCKAPFKYEWGGVGYHSAIILGSELGEDDLVYVKAVFMHPTTKKMQPCPYFLEGNCKYSDEKCHYSHGYTVRLDEVQDFRCVSHQIEIYKLLFFSHFKTVIQTIAKSLRAVQY